MTLDDADYLLMQWAVWASNELRRLDCSIAKWQSDYRPSYDPDILSEGREVEPGDDLVMLDVDTALAMVKMSQPQHHRIIVSRYRHGESFSFMQLDAAKRAFITEFASPLDKNTCMDGLTVCKRTA